MVESLYFVPAWFFNIDILLGVLFILVTSFVAGYSFKIYKVTRERNFQLFGFAFSLLSLSYLIRIMLNIFLTTVAQGPRGILLLLFGLTRASEIIIYIYVLLFVLGYLTLAYTSLRSRSKTVYIMLAALSILAVLVTEYKSLTFYFISSMFLAFISYHYYRRVKDSPKNKNQRKIFYAMLLLLASNLLFMIIGDYQFYYGYIVTETIELVAYGLIATTLFRIINHGKKER